MFENYSYFIGQKKTLLNNYKKKCKYECDYLTSRHKITLDKLMSLKPINQARKQQLNRHDLFLNHQPMILLESEILLYVAYSLNL